MYSAVCFASYLPFIYSLNDDFEIPLFFDNSAGFIFLIFIASFNLFEKELFIIYLHSKYIITTKTKKNNGFPKKNKETRIFFKKTIDKTKTVIYYNVSSETRTKMTRKEKKGWKRIHDYSILKGKIVEKIGSRRELAEKLGINETTLSNKLNNKTDFSREEMKKICKILDEPLIKIIEYFFTETVRENEQK